MNDSSWSYVHLPDQSTVLFIEKWEHNSLRFDDIELPPLNPSAVDTHDDLLQQFLYQNEDAENDISVINGNNPMFNSSYANRLRQKNKKLNWRDLDLGAFSDRKDREVIHDRTILKKPLFTNPLDNPSNYNTDDFYVSFDFSNQTGATNADNEDDERACNIPMINMEMEPQHDDIIRGLDDFGLQAEHEVQPVVPDIFSETYHSINGRHNHESWPSQFTTPTLNGRTVYHNLGASQQRRRSSSGLNRSVSNDYQTPQTTHSRMIR